MTGARQATTAVVRRVDVSASRPRASSSAVRSSTTEANLFDAYRFKAPVEVRRPCVCGGTISVWTIVPNDWDGISQAIREHQGTSRHLLWRIVQDIP